MTALAQKKDALNDAEKEMLYSIMELFEFDCDNYCDDCEAIIDEPDIGYSSCPCDCNPFDRDCIRGDLAGDLEHIEEEARKFLQNIRGYW